MYISAILIFVQTKKTFVWFPPREISFYFESVKPPKFCIQHIPLSPEHTLNRWSRGSPLPSACLSGNWYFLANYHMIIQQIRKIWHHFRFQNPSPNPQVGPNLWYDGWVPTPPERATSSLLHAHVWICLIIKRTQGVQSLYLHRVTEQHLLVIVYVF